MKVSIAPRRSERLISAKSKYLPATSVPLTEERLALLGHEIRNPLSALSYALQTWSSSTDDPQEAEKLLQIMRRQVSHLTRLCNDLLDMGGIARGNLSIRRASVDVGQVIQNACEELQPLFDQCGRTLTATLSDSPLTMMGDETRLTQVFANLMHNSAKFTDGNGHLHISLKRYHDTAVIRFRDNGHGISCEHLQDIFLPDNASTRRSEVTGAGLGIGLRLAKEIVELHGGTIEAFSDGLGQGSTFVVRLPILAEVPKDKTNTAATPSMTACDPGSPLPTYRIVVVDDDRLQRCLMARLLQNLGQSVTVAENGDAAIETIVRNQPHVVFLDLRMRGMSGYELARRIRSRVELDPVVLVALSGNSDSGSQKLSAAVGIDHQLVKPTSMAELKDTLLHIAASSTCSNYSKK